jgi:hypothetical protein
LGIIQSACKDDHEVIQEPFFWAGEVKLTAAKDSAELKVYNQFFKFVYIYDVQDEDTTFLNPFEIGMEKKSYTRDWYKVNKVMNGDNIDALKVYVNENKTGKQRKLFILVERLDVSQSVTFVQEASSVN